MFFESLYFCRGVPVAGLMSFYMGHLVYNPLPLLEMI